MKAPRQPARGPRRPARPEGRQRPEPRAAAPRVRPQEPSAGQAPAEDEARAAEPTRAAGQARPAADATVDREPEVVLRTKRRAADMDERRQERRAERNRVRWRFVRRASFSIVSLVALVWAVWFSPIFAYRVAATRVVGADTYVTTHDVKVLMNSQVGVALPRLHTKEMAAAVVDTFPNVKSASVKRNFLHGITVTMTMRTPVAALSEKSGLVPVDASGARMTLSAEETAKLPALTVDKGDITAGIAVLEAMSTDTRSTVEQIAVSKTNQVTLKLSSGTTVKWGDTSQSKLKAEVLSTLIANVKAGTYDISAPTSPVTY